MSVASCLRRESDPFDFAITEEHIATRPPELRGARRDAVRLMVTRPQSHAPAHAELGDLPEFLRPGDLLVINDSQTLAASLQGERDDGSRVRLHLSTRLREGLWSAELRTPSGTGTRQLLDGRPGEVLALDGGGRAYLEAPYRAATVVRERQRLWRTRLELPVALDPFLARFGEPIRYDYVDHPWDIRFYRTPVGTKFGSAEMPSAGRGLTRALLERIRQRGVRLATITLHTGVSSLEAGEPPYPERFEVPPATASLVEATQRSGGRIVAVGTTCVRALESAVEQGGIRPARGWTDLVITPRRGLSLVDGLLTGMHVPESSHLQMLSAFAPPERLAADYRRALQRGYLWHEFGDMHLILRR